MNAIPAWREAFPDFDNGDLLERIRSELAAFSFTDSSWKNDVCPSISFMANPDKSEARIVLWIDYAEPGLRELGPDSAMISGVFYDDEGQPVDDASSPSLTEAEAVEWARKTWLACSPLIDVPGFRHYTTGGGCMALERSNADGTHWLITDEDGTEIIRVGEAVSVGLYDDENPDPAIDEFVLPPGMHKGEEIAAEIAARDLARAFVGIIREWLTPEELEEVNRRNRNNWTTGCATHDFCDSNMAMLDAFCLIYKKEPDFLTGDQASENDVPLFNRAWDIAREREFREYPKP